MWLGPERVVVGSQSVWVSVGLSICERKLVFGSFWLGIPRQASPSSA